MKALVQDRYGTGDVLRLDDVEQPTAQAGQVLVRVVAAGMDRGAWHFMTGQPYLMRILGFGLRAPSVRVPGTNFAGVVTAVGPGGRGFSPGDEVYGAARGAFAEYVVAPADRVAPKPPQLSFEQAAVLPYPSFAAMQALRDHGHVRPGHRVLVVGASGAVGSIAVQLGVAFGAKVTGVCSGRHAGLVRSLGATHVVDHTRTDITDVARRFDLVLDIGGRTPVSKLRSVLTPTGRLVIVGGEGDRWIGGVQRQLWAVALSAFVPQTLTAFVVQERACELLRVNELVEAGKVAPRLGQSFALVDGAAAVAAFERGSGAARIVLTP